MRKTHSWQLLQDVWNNCVKLSNWNTMLGNRSYGFTLGDLGINIYKSCFSRQHRHHCPKQISPWSQNGASVGVVSLDQTINTLVFSKEQQLTSIKGLNIFAVRSCFVHDETCTVACPPTPSALSIENHTWMRT